MIGSVATQLGNGQWVYYALNRDGSIRGTMPAPLVRGVCEGRLIFSTIRNDDSRLKTAISAAIERLHVPAEHREAFARSARSGWQAAFDAWRRPQPAVQMR